MAIINFNAADALQTKVVEANIYPSEITKIDGPKKSTSGKSFSYFVDISIADGKYKGKTRTIVLNTETSSPSILGEMQFFPVSYFLQIDSAISNREIVPEDYQVDTDELLHKSMDVAWGVGTVEGRIINIINSFHPNGYAATAPKF